MKVMRAEHQAGNPARGSIASADGTVPGGCRAAWPVPVPGLVFGLDPQRISRHSQANDPLGGTGVSTDVAGLLAHRRGRGHPLPPDIARSMGEAMGVDLDTVRIHTGPEPARLARSVQATAFTVGTDIYFGAGTYAPQTAAGQRLLAHELAHTVQQDTSGGAGTAPVIGRACDPAEAAADRVADGVLQVLRRQAARQSADGSCDHRDDRPIRRTASPAAIRALSASKASAAAPCIQRVYSLNLNWADQEEMYQQRKHNNDFGPGRNKGWIKILVPPALDPLTVFAQSEYGEYHTEEKLVDTAVQTYHVNPATPPGAPPGAGPRIVALYTERQPCTAGNADPARKTRGYGNCRDFLQNILEPHVTVRFSVANSNDDHMALLGRQSLRAAAEKELAALSRYANNYYNQEHQKKLQYLPSPEGYEACLQQGLRALIQKVGARLMSYATIENVARYMETIEAIGQESLEAQLLYIDRFIDAFVAEEDQKERALMAEGDRLAAQSRTQALFPWEKNLQDQHV